MLFTSPIWLALLVPWGVLGVWLMVGVGRWRYVPFLAFWPRDGESAPHERRLRRPPWDSLLLLIALLLAILASAGLSLRGSGAIRLIIDRGEGLASRERYRSTVRRAMDLIGSTDQPVEVRFVPGDTIQTLARDLPGLLDSHNPTALPTRDLLPDAIAHSQQAFRGLTLVVTAQPIVPPSARVVVIPPHQPASNVGIEWLAAQEDGSVLARLRNDSDAKTVPLTIASGTESIRLVAELGERGTTRDVVARLPRVHAQIVASIDRPDDLAVDNQAFLVRSTIDLQKLAALPPAVERMLDIYQSHHPAEEGARRVAIAQGVSALPEDHAGVALEAATETLADRSVEIMTDLPFVKAVDWSRVSRDASVAPALGDREPDAHWRPLVKIGGRTVLAVSVGPVKQYDVRMWSNDWVSRSDFVLFWAGMLDDLCGPVDFGAAPVQDLGLGWSPVVQSDAQVEDSPGIYRKGDPPAQVMALRIGAIPIGRSDSTPVALPQVPSEGSTGLSRGLLCIALLLLPIAMAGRKGRAQSPQKP